MNQHRIAPIVLSLALLAAGCASRSDSVDRPKPGSGIVEYRNLTRDARRAVGEVVEALDAVAKPSNSKPHPALRELDRSLERLEMTSFKVRSRADAIISRGQGYFDEWKEHIGGMTNQPAARVEGERYERLHARFVSIQERSAAVRSGFQPFMMKVRGLRPVLDKSPGEPTVMEPAIADGRRVLEALDAVARALDDAEAELRATEVSYKGGNR